MTPPEIFEGKNLSARELLAYIQKNPEAPIYVETIPVTSSLHFSKVGGNVSEPLEGSIALRVHVGAIKVVSLEVRQFHHPRYAKQQIEDMLAALDTCKDTYLAAYAEIRKKILSFPVYEDSPSKK
jgi:hypothetical protein